MAKITVITNDKSQRIISRNFQAMQQAAETLKYLYPVESLRTHNAIVLRDADGYRCIVQEG